MAGRKPKFIEERLKKEKKNIKDKDNEVEWKHLFSLW